MAHPTKIGQMFLAGKNFLIVKGFTGSSEVEYSTLNDAKKANPINDEIGVLDVEFGGITKYTDCKLIL